MVITYPDGSVYTEHKDGTNFLTSADGNKTLIEHPGKSNLSEVKFKIMPLSKSHMIL